MKTCSKCKEDKPIGDFYTLRGRPVAECKTCAKARAREWAIANSDKTREAQKRFRESNPEKCAAHTKKWLSDPENRTRIREAANKWRRDNPEKRAAIEARQRAAHPERYKAKSRRYYLAHSEECKARVKKRVKNNPEWKRAIDAKYYAEHKDKWVGRPDWQKLFPEKHAAKQGRRRAHKLDATPAWANEFFMAEVYDLAKRRTNLLGVKWEVDHIVPLRSSLVCGLHVENNLRVIPAVVNRSKSNRYWPNMPDEIQHR